MLAEEVSRRIGPLRERIVRDRLWVWVVPVAVALLSRHPNPRFFAQGAGVIVGIGLVALVARAPARALVLLVMLLPFNLVIFSVLFKLGLPAGLVRVLGGWKELLGLGILVGALTAFRSSKRKLDAVDGLALSFVGLATLYLLVPGVFESGPASPFNVRLLAFRTETAFLLLFLAVRHCPMPSDIDRRFLRAALAASTAAAVVAIYEFLFSAAWNRFAINTLGVGVYRALVLNAPVPDPHDLRYHGSIGSRDLIRVGSVLFEPVWFSIFLLFGLTVCFVLIVRGRAGAGVHLCAVAISLALLLTLTRSSILDGIAIAVLVVVGGRRAIVTGRPSAGPSLARARYGLLLIAGLIVMTPVAVGVGLATRTSAALSGQELSAQGHQQDLAAGYQALSKHPLGLGLGNEPGVGDRFAVSTKVTTENAYLQVGDELGIPALLLFVALLVALVRALVRRARAAPAPPLVTVAAVVVIAMLVGGLFQHVWLEFSFAWTVWAAAGLALRAPASPSGT